MQHSARRLSKLKNPLITALILILATVVGFTFDRMGLMEINIYTIFIVSIMVTSAVTASRICSVLSASCGVLLFNYLFAEPRFSVRAVNFGYPMDLIILLCVALLVSSLARNSEQMAYRTRILLQTDQLFLKASSAQEIADIAARQLEQLLNRPVAPRLAQEGKLVPQPEAGEANERAAQQVFRSGEPCGAGCVRYGQASCHYTAIRTEERIYGVMGVEMGEKPLSELERNLLSSMLSECALALERDFYNQKREEAAVQMRHEKLRADLLRSISHDLRTPLTSISGSAGLLCDQSDLLTEDQKRKLTGDIYEDAQWLLGTVENLLSVTRIEDGRMALHLQPELMSEVVTEAVSHITRAAAGHSLIIEQADDLLMARMDARLIVQVLVNLIDNAVKYTSPGSDIIVRTQRCEGNIVVEVADNGSGIPDESKAHIFEMFYTTSSGARDGRRGLGLGLALCKAIIAAHGGDICVRDHQPHGTVIAFTLLEERIEIP